MGGNANIIGVTVYFFCCIRTINPAIDGYAKQELKRLANKAIIISVIIMSMLLDGL